MSKQANAYLLAQKCKTFSFYFDHIADMIQKVPSDNKTVQDFISEAEEEVEKIIFSAEKKDWFGGLPAEAEDKIKMIRFLFAITEIIGKK